MTDFQARGAIEDVPWFPLTRFPERAVLGKRSLRTYEFTLRGICGRCGAPQELHP